MVAIAEKQVLQSSSDAEVQSAADLRPETLAGAEAESLPKGSETAGDRRGARAGPAEIGFTIISLTVSAWSRY